MPPKIINGLRLLYFLFRDCRHAPRWLSDRFVKKDMLELRIPWLTWGAIEHLGQIVSPGMKVFEWGGGGSTLFFLDHGCRVTTLETSTWWAEGLKKRAPSGKFAGSLDLRVLDPAVVESGGTSAYFSPVADDAPWDLVLVDGPGEISRMDCIRHAMPFIRHGGFLVLDNADWPSFSGAPVLLEGWERRIFRGLIPCARGTGQTDVYRKP
ncbi:MAG: hypothetical protein ABL974_00505 [Prosthecobacter sp.]